MGGEARCAGDCVYDCDHHRERGLVCLWGRFANGVYRHELRVGRGDRSVFPVVFVEMLCIEPKLTSGGG